jgi:hypothetical protein
MFRNPNFWQPRLVPAGTNVPTLFAPRRYALPTSRGVAVVDGLSSCGVENCLTRLAPPQPSPARLVSDILDAPHPRSPSAPSRRERDWSATRANRNLRRPSPQRSSTRGHVPRPQCSPSCLESPRCWLVPGGALRQQMGHCGPTPSTGPEQAETFAPASDTTRDFTTKAIPKHSAPWANR